MIRNPAKRMTVAQLRQRMDTRFDDVTRRFGDVDKRFESIDKRFESIDKRFESVDKRFDALETSLGARIDARFGSVNDTLTAILQILDKKHDHHRKVLDVHERRLQDLEQLPRA
jgi:DNA anti-recombination protein RmuC